MNAKYFTAGYNAAMQKLGGAFRKSVGVRGGMQLTQGEKKTPNETDDGNLPAGQLANLFQEIPLVKTKGGRGVSVGSVPSVGDNDIEWDSPTEVERFSGASPYIPYRN